ncbi:MAG: hypothetical protein JSR28_07895 [Proteobacteria bacterium]|nr:hypothetical protein [Pseudomonadota bacterium]MDE2411370.1 hypothetical protein [Sphingomonadales bacterium]
MRGALLLLALALLGCKAEPSFDERFKARQKELDAKAQSIDRDIDAAQSDAADAASDQPDAGPTPARPR